MPYASLGILHIALVAGNDVNVHMKDTLSGCRPHVNTDVVAVGIELLVDALFFLVNQLHASGHLVRCQVEKAGHMAFWYDQRMARTHPVAVTGTVSKFILQ